jgi:transcriptional regulator with XRE-family HTH domain
MFRASDRVKIDATTGFGLKVRRQALGVQARTIAELMGVARSRVSAIEGARYPTRAARARYLAALRRAAGARNRPMPAPRAARAGARALGAPTTHTQGLPLLVEDPVVLDKLAVLLGGVDERDDDAPGGMGRGRRSNGAAHGTNAGPRDTKAAATIAREVGDVPAPATR